MDTPVLTSHDFTLFSQYIQKNCGIVIPQEKAYLIETRLSRLLYECGATSFDALYKKLCAGGNDIKERLIDAITTNETKWFRDEYPFVTLESAILPKLVEDIRSGVCQKARIWSAAASTGQEAYSIAMTIQSYLEKRNIKDVTLKQFEITATDISKNALSIAEKGRYDAISITRGMLPGYLNRYFTKADRAYQINDEIKSAVKFYQFNLLDSFLPLGRFDVVFCRYVLLYFSEDIRLDIVSRLYATAKDSAYMFIGATELLESEKIPFSPERLYNHIYYRKLGG